MLETIFSWVFSSVAQGASFLAKQFMALLDLNMAAFLYYVPGLSPLYSIIRGIALGFTLGIAIFNLLKFFAAPLSRVQENPFMILVRTFLAVGMIYFGGHILELIVDLFKGPYSALVAGYQTEALNFFDSIGAMSTRSIIGDTAIGAAGQLLVSVIVVISLGINVIKMLLELVERYVMVSVLVYTGPLGWSTLCTQNTMGIFSRWLNMFISQCVMMLISAWSVQVFMSILIEQSAETGMLIRGIFALAFARLAQRFDSYLQQLGLNPATTGGSMLDEIVAVGKTMSSFGKKGKKGSGSDDSVLGGTGETRKSFFWGHGAVGAAANFVGGFKAGKSASAAEGNSRRQSWLDGAKQGAANVKSSMHSKMGDGSTKQERDLDRAVSEARNGNRAFYDHLVPSQKNAADARAKTRGETPPKRASTIGSFSAPSEKTGAVSLSAQAKNNGLYIGENASGKYIGGSEAKVREFCDEALQRGDITPEQYETLTNTVRMMPDATFSAPENPAADTDGVGDAAAVISMDGGAGFAGAEDPDDNDAVDVDSSVDSGDSQSMRTTGLSQVFAGTAESTGLISDPDFIKTAPKVLTSDEFKGALKDAQRNYCGNDEDMANDIARNGTFEPCRTGWHTEGTAPENKELTFTYTAPPTPVRGRGRDDLTEQKSYTGGIMTESLYNARKKADKNDPRVTNATRHRGADNRVYYTWCERKESGL